MSDSTQAFMQIIQDTAGGQDGPVTTPPNTFMRFCAVCTEIMPHYREATYCQSVVCETKTYTLSERGYIRRDLAIALNWLVVVLFVLFILLKDWKW